VSPDTRVCRRCIDAIEFRALAGSIQAYAGLLGMSFLPKLSHFEVASGMARSQAVKGEVFGQSV
jgi:hypothetical protein